MNLVCLKEQLYKAVLLAEKHTAKTNQTPILQGVALMAKNDSLILRATNLDTGLEVWIPAKIKTEGSIVIPAKTLLMFLSALNEEKIKLESKKSNLFITTNHTSTTLKGYPSEDFPLLPTIKSANKISFSSQALLAALKSVSFAASLSEVKPEIASIYFNFKSKKEPKLVATDSFRLAERKVDASLSDTLSFLIPQRHIFELIKTLENFNDEIDVVFNNSQIAFLHPSFRYIARLTEGVFPSYEQIIPTSFTTDVSLEKKLLINALRTGGALSDRLNEVKLNVYPEDNIFEVLTRNADVGENSVQIPATITGEKVEISFNYRYLLDGLEHLPSSKILLRFNGESKPVLVQSHNDTSYIYIVMPMKGSS